MSDDFDKKDKTAEGLVKSEAEASSGSSKLRLGAMNPLFIIKVE